MNVHNFIYLLPAALLALCSCRTVPVNPVLQTGKIMFWGDSAAEQNLYPSFFEAFYRTRYPEGEAVFVERCLRGDHSGNLERIRRDGLPEKADLIYIMYGMDSSRFGGMTASGFRKDLLAAIRRFRGADPQCRFVLMSPPALPAASGEQPPALPWKLRLQARAMEDLAYEMKIPYIDQNLLYSGFAATAEGSPFLKKSGNLLSAKAAQAVLALNMFPPAEELSVISYDHAAGTIASRGSNLSPLSAAPDGSYISITRQLHRLPFALSEDLAELQPLLLPAERVNRDLFYARNLPEGSWELLIDGVKYGDYTSEALASGLNLSDFSNNPDMVQSRKVLKFTIIKNQEERKAWLYRLNGDTAPVPGKTGCCKSVQDPGYIQMQSVIEARTRAIKFHSRPFYHEITLRRNLKSETQQPTGR